MAVAKPVSSPRNPLLREVRRAIARGGLTSDGCAVAETFHLLEEALQSDCRVEFVLAAESVRTTVESRVRPLAEVQILVLPDSLLQEVAATGTSQGVIALVRPPQWSLDQLFRGASLMVVLDGLQDPGNAGTIIRSAEAFGATGVLLLKGTVNPYNPKSIRASAGSVFRLPLVHGVEAPLARAAFERRRVDLYAAMPRGGRVVTELDLTRGCAFIIGNEGQGVGKAWRAAARDVSIPVARVESLNAAAAAAVLLYEAHRQRMSPA
jgi:TrmH family RNA methyltransferase